MADGTPFSYCLLKDVQGEDIELFDLYVATDEINRYCGSGEPLVQIPSRAQRSIVSRTRWSLPRYPLQSSIAGASYIDKHDELQFIDLSDPEEAPTVRDHGRLIEWPEKLIGEYIHYVADAGFGNNDFLGVLHASEDADDNLVRIYGSPQLTTSTDPNAPTPGDLLPEDPRGMVLQVGNELMLVTSKMQVRSDQGLVNAHYWDVLRGVARTRSTTHDVDTYVHRVRPPAMLEAAARAITSALKARQRQPSRGVSRAQMVPAGQVVVQTDPLATWRPILNEYRLSIGS